MSKMPSLTLNERNPFNQHIDKKEEIQISQEADDLHLLAVTH